MTGLGNILQQARDMRGVTLEEAEQATHISRRYLQALEAEQFNVFPAPVFARGFLRNYSQYLGLDPAEMLALWPEPKEPSVAESPPTPPAGATRQRSRAAAPYARPRYSARRDAAGPSPLYRAHLADTQPTPALNIVLLLIGVLAAVAVVAVLAGKLAGSGTSVSAPRTASAGSTARLPAGAPVRATQLAVHKAGTMPNLLGQDEQTAVQALTRLGVTPLILRVPDATGGTRPGAVAVQNPKAGTQINTGPSVTLIVNAGSNPGAIAPPAPLNPAAASPIPGIPGIAGSPTRIAPGVITTPVPSNRATTTPSPTRTATPASR